MNAVPCRVVAGFSVPRLNGHLTQTRTCVRGRVNRQRVVTLAGVRLNQRSLASSNEESAMTFFVRHSHYAIYTGRDAYLSRFRINLFESGVVGGGRMLNDISIGRRSLPATNF